MQTCPCGAPVAVRCWEVDLVLCLPHARAWLASDERGMVLARRSSFVEVASIEPEAPDVIRARVAREERDLMRIAAPFIARITPQPGIRARLERAWAAFWK